VEVREKRITGERGQGEKGEGKILRDLSKIVLLVPKLHVGTKGIVRLSLSHGGVHKQNLGMRETESIR